jgi:hypothetical protein
MTYTTALRFAETARDAELLHDPFIRNLIRAVAVEDDPGLATDAEVYISFRAIDQKLSKYHRKSSEYDYLKTDRAILTAVAQL